MPGVTEIQNPFGLNDSTVYTTLQMWPHIAYREFRSHAHANSFFDFERQIKK